MFGRHLEEIRKISEGVWKLFGGWLGDVWGIVEDGWKMLEWYGMMWNDQDNVLDLWMLEDVGHKDK